ncbi:MAG: signal peptidase I [Firmicutes bacterium]|jgi:signal peptidase I|nr:signal peptidase I [Bacillota bacterium]
MSLSHEVWEWIRSIAVAVVLALIIRSFLFQVYDVEGSSMYPTLEQNNRLIVNKLVYRFREPAPGDIVVFDYEPERPFIKRVIGTGGDTIMIREGQVYRNGLALVEPYLQNQGEMPDFGPVEVPPGHLFVLGDFRGNSMDSRDPRVGFVPLEQVRGKATLIFWPPGEARILQHQEAAVY